MNKIIGYMNLKVELTLPRFISYTAYPKGSPLSFGVAFNTISSGLKFQYDTRNEHVKNKTVYVRMFRNLDNCKFCRTFFNIENFENDKKDCRGVISNTNSKYESKVVEFFDEHLNLYDRDTGGMKFENSIKTRGWKLLGYEDDVLFYYVERNFYNMITKVSTIRTCAIQFTTKKGDNALNLYYEDSCSDIEYTDDVPDFIRDIDGE